MKSLIKKHPIFFIVAVAVVVRLVLFLLIQVPDQSGGDFYFYDHLAKSLLQGNGFDGEMYVTPGYSFFLMILYFLTGTSSIIVLQIGQTIMGVLTAIATYLLTKNIFSFRTAIVAGTMMAVWPTALFAMFHFGNGLLLYTMLTTFSVVTFLRAWKSCSIVFVMLSGFLLALASLTDPIALYLPVAFGLWWLFAMLRHRKNKRLLIKKVLLLAVFFFVFILSIFPWSYRNSIVFNGVDNAPFISKQIEKDFITKKHFSSISQTFSISKLPLLTSGIQQMFIIPYHLDVLDLGTKIKYKQIPINLLRGEHVELSSREIFIFILKILLSAVHWLLLLLALLGLFLTRYRYFTALFIFILGYITFAAIGYGSLSSYKGVAPLSEFFFPFLPFLIVYASYTVTTYIPSLKSKNIDK